MAGRLAPGFESPSLRQSGPAGTELASVDLPSGAIGTPMTYMLDGRQYVALTVGGGPRLIAYALPEGGQPR